MWGKIVAPGVLSVFVVSLSGINIVSSGHISQSWVSSSWPAASWLFVMLIGLLYARAQTGAVAKASGISAAPEAEAALAYRSGFPATAFSTRAVTLFAASALLGTVVPMAWEIVVRPTVLVLSARGQIFQENTVLQFIEPNLFKPRQFAFDIGILLLASLSVFLAKTSKVTNLVRTGFSLLFVFILFIGWVLPAWFLFAYSPLGAGKADFAESVRSYQRVVSSHDTFERTVANIVSDNRDQRFNENSQNDKLESDLLKRSDDLEVYALDRLENYLNASSDWNVIDPADFPRSRSTEAARSLIQINSGGSGSSILLSSLSAACVGGWIFFSFFSLGAGHGSIASTTARQSAVSKGSKFAIYVSGALFLIGWLALNYVSNPEYNAIVSLESISQNSFFSPSILHIYGLLYDGGVHTYSYLGVSVIWALALILLVSTYIDFIAKNQRGLRIDIAANHYSKIALPTLCIIFAALGYATANLTGLFAAQIGIFLATAGIQVILVSLSETGMRRRHSERQNKPFVSNGTALGFQIITLVMIVGAFIPAWEGNGVWSAPMHLVVGAGWTVVFSLSALFAYRFYQLRRRRIKKKFGTDILVSYEMSNEPNVDSTTLTKVLIVNGLYGSRAAVNEALELAVSESIDLVAFVGPIFANSAVLIESDGGQTSQKSTYQLKSDSNRISTRKIDHEKVPSSVADLFRTEGSGIGIYSFCGDQKLYDEVLSRNDDEATLIPELIREELNWLEAQLMIAETFSIGLKCKFIAATELDRAIIAKFSQNHPWLKNRTMDSSTELNGVSVKLSSEHEFTRNPLSDLQVLAFRESNGDLVITLRDQEQKKHGRSQHSILVPRSFSESGALIASMITVDPKEETFIRQLIVR